MAEFMIFVVGLRMIVAKRIATYIEKRMAEHPIKYQRYEAIMRHYIDQAKGFGHTSGHVLSCSEGTCSSLRTVLN